MADKDGTWRLRDEAGSSCARREALAALLGAQDGASAPAWVDLGGCEAVVDDQCAELLCASDLLCAIKGLSLSGNLWLQQPFARLERRLDALVTLDLSHCIRVEDGTVEQLTRWMPRLERLDLTCCYGVTDKAVALIATRLRGLDQISLEGCSQVTDSGLQPLVQALASRLTAFNISGLLELTDNALHGTGASWFRLAAFRAVGCIRLTDKGVGAVLDVALPRELSVLDLAGVRGVSDQVFTKPTSLRKLRHVNVSGCMGLSGATLEALQGAGSLTWLRADACPRISSAALSAFRKARPLVQVDVAPHQARLDGGLFIDSNDTRALVNLAGRGVVLAGIAYFVLTVRLGWVSPGQWAALAALSGVGLIAYALLAIALLVLASGM